jgi:transcription elongation factor GreA
MEEGKRLLTQSGYEKLQSELEDLKVNARKEIAEKIKEARAQGDLSENAEYDAALDEQRDIEARIVEIETILKNSEVMEEHPDDGSINIGSRVTIREDGTDFDMDIDIVGASEANSLKGRISNESPVGMALMRRQAGDFVTVDTPEGTIRYEIIRVEHSVA